MTIMLDTPEQIAMFRFVAGIHATALEINTGMKTRGFSPKAFAAQYGYTGPATKVKVLTWLVAQAGEAYKPSTSVLKALAK